MVNTSYFAVCTETEVEYKYSTFEKKTTVVATRDDFI